MAIRSISSGVVDPPLYQVPGMARKRALPTRDPNGRAPVWVWSAILQTRPIPLSLSGAPAMKGNSAQMRPKTSGRCMYVKHVLEYISDNCQGNPSKFHKKGLAKKRSCLKTIRSTASSHAAKSPAPDYTTMTVVSEVCWVS